MFSSKATKSDRQWKGTSVTSPEVASQQHGSTPEKKKKKKKKKRKKTQQAEEG